MKRLEQAERIFPLDIVNRSKAVLMSVSLCPQKNRFAELSLVHADAAAQQFDRVFSEQPVWFTFSVALDHTAFGI